MRNTIYKFGKRYTQWRAVFPGDFVLVLIFEGKCSYLRAKSAHLVGHLPRGIDRSLIQLQNTLAHSLNPAGDPIPMQRPGAHRELSAPLDRASPGGLPISALLYSVLWTCQRRYASSIGMSIGKRRCAASLRGAGRSAGHPFGGNVATDFITQLLSYRLYYLSIGCGELSRLVSALVSSTILSVGGGF